MRMIPVQGDHNHDEPGGVQAQHPGTQQGPIVDIFLSQLYGFHFAFIAWNLILKQPSIFKYNWILKTYCKTGSK